MIKLNFFYHKVSSVLRFYDRTRANIKVQALYQTKTKNNKYLDISASVCS